MGWGPERAKGHLWSEALQRWGGVLKEEKGKQWRKRFFWIASATLCDSGGGHVRLEDVTAIDDVDFVVGTLRLRAQSREERDLWIETLQQQAMPSFCDTADEPSEDDTAGAPEPQWDEPSVAPPEEAEEDVAEIDADTLDFELREIDRDVHHITEALTLVDATTNLVDDSRRGLRTRAANDVRRRVRTAVKRADVAQAVSVARDDVNEKDRWLAASLKVRAHRLRSIVAQRTSAVLAVVALALQDP